MGAVGSCILALLEHPEVLKKAHEEIDRVLKPGHLPDFDDEPSLPYVTAVVKESMRWSVTAPLGRISHPCFLPRRNRWFLKPCLILVLLRMNIKDTEYRRAQSF